MLNLDQGNLFLQHHSSNRSLRLGNGPEIDFLIRNASAAIIACNRVFPANSVWSLPDHCQVPGRMELVPNPAGLTIYVDYAHTPDGLSNALSTLTGRGFDRIVALFGCGGDRDPTKRPKMAEAAADVCDLVIVTSDNPRTEDPQAILDQICAGFPAGFPFKRCADRRLAIKMAISEICQNDVLVICGKGHEKYQWIGTEKIPFDDVAVASHFVTEVFAKG
jgi:UDP-N-acetylmuramoyl-L-alanyl-D-glutamate--2,6-diaminopimelate ligase